MVDPTFAYCNANRPTDLPILTELLALVFLRNASIREFVGDKGSALGNVRERLSFRWFGGARQCYGRGAAVPSCLQAVGLSL